MRLVGATRWYTQLPFLIEAVLTGVVGALIAAVGLLAGKFLFIDQLLTRHRVQRRGAADRGGRHHLGLADPGR